MMRSQPLDHLGVLLARRRSLGYVHPGDRSTGKDEKDTVLRNFWSSSSMQTGKVTHVSAQASPSSAFIIMQPPERRSTQPFAMSRETADAPTTNWS